MQRGPREKEEAQEEAQVMGTQHQQLVLHSHAQQDTINQHKARLAYVMQQARESEQRAYDHNQKLTVEHETLLRNYTNFEVRAQEHQIRFEGQIALLSQKAEFQVAQEKDRTESEIATAQQHLKGWEQHQSTNEKNIDRVKAEMEGMKQRTEELQEALSDQELIRELAGNMMEADGIITFRRRKLRKGHDTERCSTTAA